MKLIKFEKDGCMLCKKMDSLLKKLGVTYETINLSEEDNKHFIEEYSIKATPTLVKISEYGIDKLDGIYSSKDLEKFCEMTVPLENVEEVRSFHCENGMCTL